MLSPFSRHRNYVLTGFAFSPGAFLEPASSMPTLLARLRIPAAVRFSLAAIAAESLQMQQEPAADHHPGRSRSSVSPSLLRLQPDLDEAADGLGAAWQMHVLVLRRRTLSIICPPRYPILTKVAGQQRRG